MQYIIDIYQVTKNYACTANKGFSRYKHALKEFIEKKCTYIYLAIKAYKPKTQQHDTNFFMNSKKQHSPPMLNTPDYYEFVNWCFHE